MLHIQVHFRNQIYDIEANNFDSVSSLLPSELSGLTNTHNVKFFSKNGQVLLPSFSLGFYGVTDNCEVFIKEVNDNASNIVGKTTKMPPLYVGRKFKTSRELLNQETRSKVFFNVLGFVPDPETMQTIVDEITDPKVSLEAARIKDKQFLKVESVARSHRMVMNRYNQYQRKQLLGNSASFPPSSVYATSSPSADTLPAFWDVKEKIEC